MKTNLKKIIAMVLMVALVVAVTIPMTGCSKKVADDENTLEIYATNSGYGIEWIKELIPIFEEQNPGTKVVFKYDTGVEIARQKVLAGPSANTADLMFTAEDWNTIVLQGDKATAGYDYAIEDLTEFLNEKDENGVALRDKFLPYYLESNAIEIKMENGEYEYRDFVLPWSSSYHGLVYNKTMFDKNGWELPNTTDELLALTDEIKAAGVTPLVNETLTGYIGYMARTMFAQFLGVDEYYEYLNPISEEDYYMYSATSGSKARLYAMYVMDDLLNPTYGRLSTTAQEDDYGRAQGRLISGEGAMIIIGDWFENEMAMTIQQAAATGNDYESGMMAFPVISALSEKLSYWDDIIGDNDYQHAYTGSVEGANLPVCDKLLSALVDYVDGGKIGDLPSVEFNGKIITTTAKDAEIVEEARRTYYTIGNSATAVIPSYATAKEAAKKFLKLVYSDVGIEIYLKNTSGGSLPMQYDFTKWSGYENATSFQKSVYELRANGLPAACPTGMLLGTSLPLPRSSFYLYAKDNSKYVSPETYFINDSFSKEDFIDVMKNAGLF